MKALLLSVFAALVTTQAHGLTCTDSNAGIDNGYFLKFSSSLKKVTVSEQTIAGPRQLTKLTCSKIAAPQNPGPDQSYPILRCWEPDLVDAGFSLLVQSPGFAGVTTATLSQVTIAQATPVASFYCQQ